MTNALAYYDTEWITTVKSFMIQVRVFHFLRVFFRWTASQHFQWRLMVVRVWESLQKYFLLQQQRTGDTLRDTHTHTHTPTHTHTHTHTHTQKERERRYNRLSVNRSVLNWERRSEKWETNYTQGERKRERVRKKKTQVRERERWKKRDRRREIHRK